jgi:5-hydroxyisourate hydrolase-like protein (transthyretin family)
MLEAQMQVEINVYDMMGSKVAELEKSTQSAGQYKLLWNTENLPPGIYHLQLRAGENKVSRKIVLIK